MYYSTVVMNFLRGTLSRLHILVALSTKLLQKKDACPRLSKSRHATRPRYNFSVFDEGKR